MRFFAFFLIAFLFLQCDGQIVLHADAITEHVGLITQQHPDDSDDEFSVRANLGRGLRYLNDVVAQFIDPDRIKLSPFVHYLNNTLQRIMIKFVVKTTGDEFRLVFDTGSTSTWLPQVDCEPKNHRLGLCRGEHGPLYDPEVDGDATEWGPFGEKYGINDREMDRVSGKMYNTTIKIDGRFEVDASIGSASWVGSMEAGIFGAGPMYAMATTFPLILLLHQQGKIKKPQFTVAINNWNVHGHYARTRHNAATIVLGHPDTKTCKDDYVYTDAGSSGEYWELDVANIEYAPTHAEPHYRHLDIDPDDDIILDTGCPFIAIPDNVYKELHFPMPMKNFPCNSSMFDVRFRIRYLGRTTVITREHLLHPLDAENCNLQILPMGDVVILGIPFYRAAGCVLHDYEEKRVGFADYRNPPK